MATKRFLSPPSGQTHSLGAVKRAGSKEIRSAIRGEDKQGWHFDGS